MELLEKESEELHKKLGLGPEWNVERYDDGSQILTQDGDYLLTIERVVMPRSKMPRWCICNRKDGEFADDDTSLRYPTILSGPFSNLAGALAAYKILANT